MRGIRIRLHRPAGCPSSCRSTQAVTVSATAAGAWYSRRRLTEPAGLLVIPEGAGPVKGWGLGRVALAMNVRRFGDTRRVG